MDVYTKFRSELHNGVTEYPLLQKELIYRSRHSKIYLITLIPKSNTSLEYKIIMKTQKKRFRQNIQHSFRIGHFIINRLKSPFYCLTYDNVSDSRKEYLLLEYIKGITLREYLRQKKSSTDENDFFEFICIFIKIIDSLNIVQQKYFFTHYDLHLSNIILCDDENKDEYSYLCSYALDTSIYHMNHQKAYLRPVLIDFEYSTAKRVFNTRIHPDYGYIGIFFSGIDIIRLLFCIKRETMTLITKEDSFYSRIHKLVNNILTNCYNINSPESFTVEQLKRHSQLYYYMLHTSHIFKSPLPIMEYIVTLYENNLQLKLTQSHTNRHRIQYDDLVSYDNLLTDIQTNNIYLPSVFSSRETHVLFLRKYKAKFKQLFKRRYNIFKSNDILLYHKFVEIYRAIETISQFVNRNLRFHKNQNVNDIYDLTTSPLAR